MLPREITKGPPRVVKEWRTTDQLVVVHELDTVRTPSSPKETETNWYVRKYCCMSGIPLCEDGKRNVSAVTTLFILRRKESEYRLPRPMSQTPVQPSESWYRLRNHPKMWSSTQKPLGDARFPGGTGHCGVDWIYTAANLG